MSELTRSCRDSCLAFARITRMALLTLGLASCTDPFGARWEFEAPPELEGLTVSYPGLRDGGVFALVSVAADPDFRLPPERYLPVEVTTSRGDVEELRLVRMACGVAYCHLVSAVPAPGYSLSWIESVIRDVGGRVGNVVALESTPRQLLLTAWVLDGNSTAFRDRLMRRPGFESVELQGFYWGGWQPVWERYLTGGIPLASSPVGPRDGVLSLAPGDTVRSRYEDRLGGVALLEMVFQGFDE